MSKLYEIVSEIAQLAEAIDEAGGELTPELSNALESLGLSLEEKTDSICRLVREDETDAVKISDEIERLQAMKRARENRARRLKDYLRRCLEIAGQSHVKTPLFRVSLCSNSRPSVTWGYDMADLPEQFRRVTIELNRDAAIEAYKAGDLPPGFSVEQGKHLRIT